MDQCSTTCPALGPQLQIPQEKNLLAHRATATEIEWYYLYVVIAWHPATRRAGSMINFGGAPRRGYGDIVLIFCGAPRRGSGGSVRLS